MLYIKKIIKTMLASFVFIGSLLFSQSSLAFCTSSYCETYEDALSYCSTRRLAFPPPTFQWCGGPDAPNCAYCRIVPASSPAGNPYIDHGYWSDYWGTFIVDSPITVLNRYPVGQDYMKSLGLNSSASAPNSAVNLTPKTCNPINISSGNKYKRQIDIAKTTYNLGFSRFYNSRSPYVGNMGKKWTHTYSRQLRLIGAFNFRMIRANGQAINYFTLGTDAPSSADADVTATLTKRKDSAGVQIGWLYRGHDNTQENYNLNGLLTSIIYLNGNTETIIHDASNRVSQVVNSFGYSLSFTYDASNRVKSVTDQAGRVWAYTYDANNNLKDVTNADLSKRVYLYTNTTFVNLLTGITDERGLHYASVDYDAQAKATASYKGSITALLNERISGVSLTHNSDGSKTLTNSRGKVSSYQTSSMHGVNIVSQFTGTSCAGGAKSSLYNYDFGTSNLISKTIDGLTTQFGNYNSQGYPGHKILAPGTTDERRMDYTYDARFYGKVATMSGPSVCTGQKRTTTYTYNAAGKITQRTINGFTPQCSPVSRTVAYEYNGPFNQLSKIDGPRTDVSDISTISYYPLTHTSIGFRGRLQAVTNALGVNTISSVQYSNTGKVLSYSDANGITYNMTYFPGNDWLKSLTQSKAGTSTTTSWTYLKTGEVNTITQNAGTPDAMSMSFSYDQARRLTKITDGVGNSIQYTLDTEGNRTATQHFDPTGTLAKQLNATFDAYNRVNVTQQVNESLTQVHNPNDTAQSTTDGKNAVTQHSYDALQRLTQTTMDANGSNTSTQNAIIKYSYDISDRLTQVVDPNNGTTTYEYDDLGNKLKTTSADTGTKTMSYDVAGNLLTLTDAKGQVFSYTYDALNRLTSINAPGTTDDITYIYDTCPNAVLKLCSTTQGVNAVSYAYDNLGSVTNHQGIAYTYDVSRRVKTVTYPNGRVILTYQYDAAGRVSSLSANVNGTTSSLANSILYSPFGPIKSLTYGNGKTLGQSVDLAYRFTNINILDALILNYPSYDAIGNILSKTNATTATSVIDWTYSYDPLNRLTAASEILNALSYAYSYDKNGNRLQKTENTNTSTYGYVVNSNLLNLINTTTITRDANGNTLNQNGFNYAFNPYNRLITVTQGPSSINPSITTVGSYQYNALGQRIQKVVSLPTSSTYLVTRKDLRSLKNALRAAGRNETLSTVCTALETWVDNELNQFKGGNKDYRADAQQLVDQLKSCILTEAKYNSVKQTILSQADTGPTNSTTTFTFGLSGELVSEINTTTKVQKDYVYLNGKPLAMIKHTNNAGVITSQIFTIHNDHLGTPQAMTNSAGVTVWNASYGPFGKGTPNQDVNNDGIKVTLNIRFPGQYYDKEAGLHYNYFRVYDPNSGRYITSDPIGLAGGLNTFGYVNGNPLIYTDKYGLFVGHIEKSMKAGYKTGQVISRIFKWLAGGATVGTFIYEVTHSSKDEETINDPVVIPFDRAKGKGKTQCDDKKDDDDCDEWLILLKAKYIQIIEMSAGLHSKIIGTLKKEYNGNAAAFCISCPHLCNKLPRFRD